VKTKIPMVRSEHKGYSEQYLALVNFKVPIMPSQVVKEWNDLESNHFYSSCQLAWDFLISFKNKLFLAPDLVLSYRFMCKILTEALDLPFLILLLMTTIYGS
jgi:hypothetical protein